MSSKAARGSTRGHLRHVVITLALLTFALPAHAWKPITHVYFAEQARLDAVDDGRVTFYATDFDQGRLQVGADGQPLRLGDYAVDPVALNALRSAAAQFRAGTLGPDAYPDLMTGQQIIHPAGRNTPGEPADMDLNPNGPGSDPWLQYLYARAFTGRNPDGSQPEAADQTPQTQAFVLGYLSHAAGDMYGHTFMNHFTGGPFHFMPRPENAIKHVVLEGYVCHRTPALPSYDASIAGVEGFIYRDMVRATPGSYLANHLLVGDNTRLSLPYVFSRMRAHLQRDIDLYYGEVAAYQSRIDAKMAAAAACKAMDFSCSRVALTAQAGAIKTEQLAYRTKNGPWVTYEEHWRDDIDAGLAALPQLSHDLALALMFNPAGSTDVARAKVLAQGYVTQHLLSMAGAPDFVGATMEAIDRVMAALGIPAVQQAIAEMKSDLLNYLINNATGMTLDDWASYASDPERWFDQVLGGAVFNTEGTGTQVSLAAFNRDQLRITDPGSQDMNQKFDLATFAPGHNTTTMIKLLLLSPDGQRQLMRDLGGDPGLVQGSNAMLGFIETLDGSNQWKANPRKMPFAADDAVYRKLFLRQAAYGEPDVAHEEPVPPPPPAPAPAPVVQSEVKGPNVSFVAYPGGQFAVVAPGRWRESSATGNGGFDFTEQGRDEWSVYLRDESRRLSIQLDLWQKKIYLTMDGGQRGELYTIERSVAQ